MQIITVIKIDILIKVVHNRYAKNFLSFNISETSIFCSLQYKNKKKLNVTFHPHPPHVVSNLPYQTIVR